MSLSAGAESSHFGGGLSIVEITATLFGSIMNYDPKNPEWEDRDRFILSKGHACLSLYAVLNYFGYFSNSVSAFFLFNSNSVSMDVWGFTLLSTLEVYEVSLGLPLVDLHRRV